MIGLLLYGSELFIFATSRLAKAGKDSGRQAGVKCKRRETRVRRSARACTPPPPPSKRNLADTMEYRIFNTPPGNAKRGARQWLFLGTDSRSFISTRRFLYTNRYAAVVVYAKAQRRHLRRENRERIHYAEVSVQGTVRSHVISRECVYPPYKVSFLNAVAREWRQ